MNLAYSDSVTVGAFDGEILVSLKPEHSSTPEYVKILRRELNRRYHERGIQFFFQPADIISQILNFGIPAPIDIQVAGPIRNYAANTKLAKDIERRVSAVPGAADVHIHQIDDLPEFRIDVDRTRATQRGVSQLDVSKNMVVTLSSSSFVATNWWLNPANGVDYLVAVQTPTHNLDSTESVMNTPVRTGNGTPMRLDNFADLHRGPVRGCRKPLQRPADDQYSSQYAGSRSGAPSPPTFKKSLRNSSLSCHAAVLFQCAARCRR